MKNKSKWRTGLPPVSDEPYLFKLKHGHDALGIGWIHGHTVLIAGNEDTLTAEDISGWMPLNEAARILDGREA